MSELLQSARENAIFLLVTAGICLGTMLLAKLCEATIAPVRKVSPARRAALLGVCAALATVLHILDFPLPFLAPEFYKLDFSELPVLMCGFYLGPTASVACEGLKILLKLLLKGTSTAFVGDFANFAVGCVLVLPAVVIYHRKKTHTNALVGLTVGTICMTVFGSLFNAVYLLPKFAQLYGLPLDVIVAMGTKVNGRITSVSTLVLWAVAPLNLIKGIMVSFLTVLLYKRVERPLFGKE